MRPTLTDPFHTRLTVQVGDLNYGNHLSNDAVLRLVHETRIRWLAEQGYSELDCGNGAGLIMVEAHVRYLAQAFHGDELACCQTAGRAGRSGLILHSTLTREADRTPIAEARCTLRFFDYRAQRIARPPQAFLALNSAPSEQTID